MGEAASSRGSTDVFVVGGGPAGLAMGLLLERFGVNCVVAEKSASTTDHPKSRGCWVRTMELFRQWGIEERVRARGLPDKSDVFVFVESMAGHEFGRTRPEPNLQQTPSWKCLVAQDVVEEEFHRQLQGAKHTQVLFSTEVVNFEETADGVTVRTRSVADSSESSWTARYLIAADGAGSPTRRQAGIEMKGPAVLAVMANEYWRADLSHLRTAREAAGFRIIPARADLPATTILNTNARDRWLTVTQIGIEQDERPKPWSDQDVVALTRAHTGIDGLDVQIINRTIWRVSKQIAGAFRQRRVFLVGDAAHRFPPTGGFGLNSSVQDAHNLAWKLAYVLRGWASERLLDSYDEERRPIAESNAEFSYGNRRRFQLAQEAVRSGNPDRVRFWINDMDNHLHSIGQSLGFSYESGAVIPDGTVAKALDSRTYTPTDRPGSRFPHLWLDLARRHSTLDWFDRDLALVVGPFGTQWLEAGKRVGESLGLPLSLRQLPHADERDGIHLGMRGAALVRPDGHVAWRMPWVPPDPVHDLGAALRKLLH